MRILDQATDKSVGSALLLLKEEEATELIDALTELLSRQKESSHAHVTDLETGVEVTLAVYGEGMGDGFAPRVQELIRHNR